MAENIGSQSQSSQLIERRMIESANILAGEVYYYTGCGLCEKSNPRAFVTEDGGTHQCRKESCAYNSKPRTYMIIRNIQLSQHVPGYADRNFVCFNSVCEELFERTVYEMTLEEAQAYFNRNIAGSTISATVDIRNPSDPDLYGICLCLKDISFE